VKDSSDFAANGALGKAFREQIVSMRLGEVRRLIERAIGRGEIQSDVDVVLVHDFRFGFAYCRLAEPRQARPEARGADCRFSPSRRHTGRQALVAGDKNFRIKREI
jgi:Tetracyclin repressor-like, C-terminal domain